MKQNDNYSVWQGCNLEFGLVLSLDLEGKKISSKVRKIKKTIKKNTNNSNKH